MEVVGGVRTGDTILYPASVLDGTLRSKGNGQKPLIVKVKVN